VYRLAPIGPVFVRLFIQPWRLAVLLAAAVLGARLEQHLPTSGIAGLLSQVAITTGTVLIAGPFVLLPPISGKRQAPASAPRQRN
jgi:hypothetical protein